MCTSELNPMDYPPVPRYFRQATNCDNETIKKADRHSTIQVMCYNLLADGLAQKSHFPYASEKELEFTFRAPRIMEEINNSGAGIICLQELNHVDDFYEAALKQNGF